MARFNDLAVPRPHNKLNDIWKPAVSEQGVPGGARHQCCK